MFDIIIHYFMRDTVRLYEVSDVAGILASFKADMPAIADIQVTANRGR